MDSQMFDKRAALFGLLLNIIVMVRFLVLVGSSVQMSSALIIHSTRGRESLKVGI